MAGPNLNGTSLFGGFIDPMLRKDMQQRRKLMPMTQALNPQKVDARLPGAFGTNSSPFGVPRGTSPTGAAPRSGSIFSRFGNGY